MDHFEIVGNNKLSGKVTISGAKNSVLPLIITSVMTNDVVTFEDVPKIKDVKELTKILNFLGSNIIASKQGNKFCLAIDNKELSYKDLIIDEVSKFRASYYFMGAFIGRYKKCRLLLPGGCYLGPRPIDLHLLGFKSLGVVVNEVEEGDKKYIDFSCPNGLCGNDIFLDFPSVGATINIMLAAVFAKGETRIENVAKEPEIIDVATMLNNMGAKIKGAGTNEIRIEGVETLNGCFHQVIPDRIEAGTYLMMGALLGEDLLIENIIPEHLEALTSKLIQIGFKFDISDDSIYIEGNQNEKLIAKNIKVGTYPSFATDLQQIYSTLATQLDGESIILDGIYPQRFKNCNYLNDMGANIDVIENENIGKAIINGKSDLVGKEIYATDLRAGAALIFAGLLAKGTTHVYNVEHILRGYDSILEKLTNIGADIKLVKDGNNE